MGFLVSLGFRLPLGRFLTLPLSRTLFTSAGGLFSAAKAAPPAPETPAPAAGEAKAIDPSQINEFRLVAKKERKKYVKCDVEASIKYMSSAAYKETYGALPVWAKYRRNFKGHFPPRTPSRPCVHHQTQMIMAGNPCPLCRDEFLVTDYRNVTLLKQFIDPISGQVLHPTKSGLCSFQHDNLLIAILKAWDEGTLELNVPFREYDFQEWYGDAWTRHYGTDAKGPADVFLKNVQTN